MEELSGKIRATITADQRTRYRPIGEYGVIGDCRTAALIAPDGSIDWLCMPHFDSPAIFCRILDTDKGGAFRLCPIAPDGSPTTYHSEMAYLPDTNILETTFSHATGRIRLLDFMPIRKRQMRNTLLDRLTNALPFSTHSHGQRLNAGLERELGNDVAAAHRVTRIATCIEGSMSLEITCNPAFDYARRPATFEPFDLGANATGVLITDGEHYLTFVVRCLHPIAGATPLLNHHDAQGMRFSANLSAGAGLIVALNYARNRAEALALLETLKTHDSTTDLDETRAYWREWAAACAYTGSYQYAVIRSALTLKLCTFEPTGAIIAAPTTSLPEGIGGVRNWDYRYTWLRDSSFTLGALDRLGYTSEARDYFHFLHDLQIQNGSDLRIMYSVRGASDGALAEHTLDHLSGYRDSHPVRIGNGAAEQRQMDIYGELLDAAYSYVRHAGFKTSHGPERDLRELSSVIAEYVVQHWQDDDRGIWEVRGAPRAFVYSRAMCWVALDRACKLAPQHGHHHQLQRWSAARDAIHAQALAHGYDQELHSFTQSYGAKELDAANLRLPLTGFLPWTDERVSSTVAATKQTLAGPNDLLYRYRPITNRNGAAPSDANKGADDGLPGAEGAFLACGFWLIDNLCYLGQVEEARQRFEKLLSFATPLGLYAEEIDPESGELLGNYPQAFTHIGLINSAVNLQRAQEGTLRHDQVNP